MARVPARLTVRVYLGDAEIKQSELKNLVINNKTVDRIVNATVDRMYGIRDDDPAV